MSEPLTAEEESQARKVGHPLTGEWVGRLWATLDAARDRPGLPKEYRIRSNGIDYIAFRRDEWTARDGQGLDVERLLAAMYATMHETSLDGHDMDGHWDEWVVAIAREYATAQQREGAGE